MSGIYSGSWGLSGRSTYKSNNRFVVLENFRFIPEIFRWFPNAIIDTSKIVLSHISASSTSTTTTSTTSTVERPTAEAIAPLASVESSSPPSNTLTSQSGNLGGSFPNLDDDQKMAINRQVPFWSRKFFCSIYKTTICSSWFPLFGEYTHYTSDKFCWVSCLVPKLSGFLHFLKSMILKCSECNLHVPDDSRISVFVWDPILR